MSTDAPTSVQTPLFPIAQDGADLPAATRRRPRSHINFEGGLDAPFHRWFRLTPSFSPNLVEEWLKEHGPDGGKILDPFCGAGTTCVVASSAGFESIGYEVNPFLAFVSEVSTDWSLSGRVLADAYACVLASTERALAALPDDPERVADALGCDLPPIHNIYRWWRRDILRELIVLRWAIREYGAEAQQHLLLALAEITYGTANISLGRLQVYFVDRSSEVIDVLGSFKTVVQNMVEDLTDFVPQASGKVSIKNADSRTICDLENESLNGLFTSPPYPNRYSYVWNTRPHLYLLEFITTAREAGDLDCETIGGTWGRATSNLQKGLIAPSPNVESAAGDVLPQLHERSTLMGNYVTKYFNDLDTHLAAVRPKMLKDAPVGYVVGNTETKGIMVETHDILARLLSKNGFGRIEQKYLRDRNSGFGLTEVTVMGVAS